VAGPGVGLEILQMVLEQGTETTDVDYKSTLDLSRTHDKVELAKDVAAFQAVGGHIVIGVDGQG
jgi:riboflavin synthase alpha subunit